jgi:hypothetical protein
MAILFMHLMISALFEVQELALPERTLHIFLAPGDGAGTLEVFALTPEHMHIYFDGDPEKSRVIALPPHTTAIDVFDLNNDGTWEMIAVVGRDIYSFPLKQQPDPSESEILFRQESTLSTQSGQPFLHVLGIEWKGQRVIGLPTDDSYQLHRRTGELAASFPIGLDAPHRAHLRPFSSWVITPPQVGLPEGIELRISRIQEVEPQLPEELLPLVEWGPLYRTQSNLRAEQAYHSPVERWPWFPLQQVDDEVERVYYAFDDARHQNTVVRLRHRDSVTGVVETSPHRRYPGRLIEAAAAAPPDFNGDGYADLVLWQTPEPSPTLGTLTRTALRGSWPLRISAHLYDPALRRFAAEAASTVKLDAPLVRFIEERRRVPVEQLLIDDFDGDGQSDLAIAPDSKSLLVWRFGEDGFSARPESEYTFARPVQELVFSGRLGEQAGYGIGLRSDDRLYLLGAEKK